MTLVNADAPVATSAVGEGLWFLSAFISKPVAIAVAAFALVSGGWTATVSAAADSLPGDPFYSIKRITEQTQLRLASLDRRAVLHTEFAGRRLAEATVLRSDAQRTPEKETLARTALGEYRVELERAAKDVQDLATQSNDSAVEVATNVQEQVVAMETALDAVAAESTTIEAGQEAFAAKDAATTAATAATTAAVDVHEAENSAVSTREMKEMFHRQLGAVEARQTFDLHRIDVLATAISANAAVLVGADVPSADDLRAWGFAVQQAGNRIPVAMSAFARGGYREAFRVLREIATALNAVEMEIAAAEISLTQSIAASANIPSVTVEEDTTVDVTPVNVVAQEELSLTP